MRRAVRVPNADYRVWLIHGVVCNAAGLADEARNAAEQLLTRQPDFTIRLFRDKWYSGISNTLMDRIIPHLKAIGLPVE